LSKKRGGGTCKTSRKGGREKEWQNGGGGRRGTGGYSCGAFWKQKGVNKLVEDREEIRWPWFPPRPGENMSKVVKN